MNRPLFVFPIVALFAVGCSSTPEAKAPTAPPPTATGSPAPAGTTCIGDQCGAGSVSPQPAPSGTAVAPQSPGPTNAFIAEVEGVKTPVTNGMILSVEYPRMTALFNGAAKPDCSNVKVNGGLVAKPGPVCVVWADTVSMKKGDSKPVRFAVDSSEVNFTLAVK